MTRRMRTAVFLLSGSLALLLVHVGAAVWGRSGGGTVKTHSAQPASADQPPLFRLQIGTVNEESPDEVIVSEPVYNAVHIGDTLEFSSRRIPLLDIELMTYRVTRGGNRVVAWREGNFFFWVVAAGVATLAAFLVTAIIDGITHASKSKLPPQV